MSHVDEGTLHAWLDGALDASSPEGERVGAHLDACEDCRRRMEEALRIREEAGEILDAAAAAAETPPFEEIRRRAGVAGAGPAGGDGEGDAGAPREGRRSGLRPGTIVAWAASVVLALAVGRYAGGPLPPGLGGRGEGSTATPPVVRETETEEAPAAGREARSAPAARPGEEGGPARSPEEPGAAPPRAGASTEERPAAGEAAEKVAAEEPATHRMAADEETEEAAPPQAEVADAAGARTAGAPGGDTTAGAVRGERSRVEVFRAEAERPAIPVARQEVAPAFGPETTAREAVAGAEVAGEEEVAGVEMRTRTRLLDSAGAGIPGEAAAVIAGLDGARWEAMSAAEAALEAGGGPEAFLRVAPGFTRVGVAVASVAGVRVVRSAFALGPGRVLELYQWRDPGGGASGEAGAPGEAGEAGRVPEETRPPAGEAEVLSLVGDGGGSAALLRSGDDLLHLRAPEPPRVLRALVGEIR